MLQKWISFLLSLLVSLGFAPQVPGQTAQIAATGSAAAQEPLSQAQRAYSSAVRAKRAADGPRLGVQAQSAPIEISNAAQLEAVRLNLGGHYILTRDFRLPEGDFEPIGSIQAPFYGSFDGNGFAIGGLTVNETPLLEENGTASAGLFGANAGVIQNLWLENCSVRLALVCDGAEEAMGYVGAIAGWNEGVIENCYVTGAVTGLASGDPAAETEIYAGGVVGYQSFTGDDLQNEGVFRVRSTAAVSAGSAARAYAGGIVSFAENAARLQRCVNLGTVTAQSSFNQAYAGGILGSTDTAALVERCANFGGISTQSQSGNSYAGGLAGYLSITLLRDCVNFGAVSAASGGVFNKRACAGGLLGNSYVCVPVTSYSTGAVSATGTGSAALYAGGGVGYCYSNGDDPVAVQCYYLQGTAAQAVGNMETDDVVALTGEQLHSAAAYLGFDPYGIWQWVTVESQEALGVTAYLRDVDPVAPLALARVPDFVPRTPILRANGGVRIQVDPVRGLVYGLPEKTARSALFAADHQYDAGRYLYFEEYGRAVYSGASPEEYVCTGDTLTLYDAEDTVAAVYQMVIFGDVNSDGVVDAADAAIFKQRAGMDLRGLPLDAAAVAMLLEGRPRDYLPMGYSHSVSAHYKGSIPLLFSDIAAALSEYWRQG
ncbi:MAG: hypothetical protein LBQ33_04525 [Oscillospiraceae bacterium]|jgi:hypothetical protein|nr:hypothetical protein [Oscillospiraceae bacterium]